MSAVEALKVARAAGVELALAGNNLALKAASAPPAAVLDALSRPLLPYGVEPTGHVWMHSRCWPAWYEARKAKAVFALKAMGIDAPVGRPMKREEQFSHLSSDAARESRAAKN